MSKATDPDAVAKILALRARGLSVRGIQERLAKEGITISVGAIAGYIATAPAATPKPGAKAKPGAATAPASPAPLAPDLDAMDAKELDELAGIVTEASAEARQAGNLNAFTMLARLQADLVERRRKARPPPPPPPEEAERAGAVARDELVSKLQGMVAQLEAAERDRGACSRCGQPIKKVESA